MMRVSVFGLGYVGCVTAACLARNGHQVTGVDVNPDKVDMLGAGTAPLVEPGLAELIAEVTGSGRLRATTDTEAAIAASDVALVCVGTPGRGNGQLEVEAVARVAHAIGQALRGRQEPFTVVLRSTVLPGTTETILEPHLREGAGSRGTCHIRVAYNPEFMREGCSLADFARPPFTLVGVADPGAGAVLRGLYAGVEGSFLQTAIRTAEMVKYVSNAYHAVKVAFANEIGDLCEALGADAQETMRIFRMDKKLSISESYLKPGFAFGGSCLPKDLRALLYGARSVDLQPALLGAILASNEAQVRRGVDSILATGKRRVGVVGLSFKEGTDDLRESPMVTLVETLIGKGREVRILDRNVSLARLLGANRRYIEEQIPHVASLMCDSVGELLAHAEVLVIGNTGEEAACALAEAGAQHVVIDLTRGAVPKQERPGAAA
jgi:GDP-mannose 6-dehydrogenase